MKLTPQLAQRIKDKATTLFKAGNYYAYAPELQAVICTLVALSDLVPTHAIELVERKPHEPVDDL